MKKLMLLINVIIVGALGTIMPLFSSENGEKNLVIPLVDYLYNAQNDSVNKLHISSPIDLNYWGVFSYNFSPSKKYLLINVKNIATSTTRLMGRLTGELAPSYTTKLFNTQSGKEIKSFDFVEPTIMYEFSPNEKIVLIAGLKKGITEVIGLTATSRVHADPSRKRAPIDTGEILQYELFDIESQASLKTLENIQAINFNKNNELIVKYDDNVVEKITFFNKRRSIFNFFSKSIEETQITAQETENLNIIQAMYDVQQSKTLYVGLSTKEILPCPNTIFYDFSPQKQYVFIKQLPARSIPAQSLQSIVRNVASGTTGYFAGTAIRTLIGGVPGIITGGISAPILGYVVGNIVADVRSIADFIAIKDGKVSGSFKNVVTYEFTPDEKRLLILCPEEGWIKLGDTPVYQLFNMETGKNIKVFDGVETAYFQDNELIIIKGGNKISCDPETGDVREKEEREEQEKSNKQEYQQTFLGRMSHAIEAVKERGLPYVMATTKEILGKNKSQEELLPTTMKYEYPVEELHKVVVEKEPSWEQPKEVIAEPRVSMEPKFYESAWEELLDDLSNKKNWGSDGFPTKEWRKRSIKFAIKAIQEDEARANDLANELYNAYLNEAKRRQNEVIRQQMARRERVVSVDLLKDLEIKAHEIKEDFLKQLNQKLPSNMENHDDKEIEKQKIDEDEEERGEDVTIEKQKINEEESEEGQKAKDEKQAQEAELLQAELEKKAELEASLKKAIQPSIERDRQKKEAEVLEILKNLSIQGLSQEWQNNIIDSSIALIKLTQELNKDQARKEVVARINEAIDNYSAMLWFTNKKTILDAKNNIFARIFNDTLKDFGEFTDYFEEVADSPLDTENINKDSRANWLYDQNKSYFNLNPTTLEEVAEDAAALITDYGVPIELLESIMNKDLQKVRKG